MLLTDDGSWDPVVSRGAQVSDGLCRRALRIQWPVGSEG